VASEYFRVSERLQARIGDIIYMAIQKFNLDERLDLIIDTCMVTLALQTHRHRDCGHRAQDMEMLPRNIPKGRGRWFPSRLDGLSIDIPLLQRILMDWRECDFIST